jgi:hypothetical protein
MCRALFLVLFALLSSCRGATTRTTDAGPCTKSGESCLFEQGKLGICVEIEREAGPPSLVCQSQH